MRVFFALPVPENIQNECLQIIKEHQTQPHHEDVRWVHRDHLHITLRFISEISPEQLTQLEILLREKITQRAPIQLATRKLLLFPPRNPHLFAMGIHLNKELANLYCIINDATITAGLPEERRSFVPHITLGRFKHPAVSDQFRMQARPVVTAGAQEVILYHSEPNDSGSNYTKLHSFQLDSD